MPGIGINRVRGMIAAAMIASMALALGPVGADRAEAAAYVGTNVLRNWEPLLLLRSGPNGPQYDVVALKNKATGRCIAYFSNNTIRTSNQCHEDDTVSSRKWYAHGTGWNNVGFYLPWGSQNRFIESNGNGDVYPATTFTTHGIQRWKFGF